MLVQVLLPHPPSSIPSPSFWFFISWMEERGVQPEDLPDTSDCPRARPSHIYCQRRISELSFRKREFLSQYTRHFSKLPFVNSDCDVGGLPTTRMNVPFEPEIKTHLRHRLSSTLVDTIWCLQSRVHLAGSTTLLRKNSPISLINRKIEKEERRKKQKRKIEKKSQQVNSSVLPHHPAIFEFVSGMKCFNIYRPARTTYLISFKAAWVKINKKFSMIFSISCLHTMVD